MAISLSIKTNDTSTGVSPATLTVAALNYAADWRKHLLAGNGNILLENITAPTSYPETFKLGWTKVSDIYAGTDVEKSLWLPTRRGFQILTQLDSVYGITDSADPTYAAALPVHAHMVLRYPNNELITSSVVKTHICRMLASLFETGSTTTSRIESLMRGVLLPTDL